VTRIRLVHVLSENWTLTPPHDLRALVRMAQEAEDAGFDAVMVRGVVLGGGATRTAVRTPRLSLPPGPAMPWPSSLVLLSAIASATTTLRLAAAAVIAPLRHPLLLAKDLATLDLLSGGRLVVLPTVSWHEPEYRALGVSFADRGALLDEHLAAWQAAWGPSPVSFAGRFYAFEDVWLEPKPLRSEGVRLWFGSSTLHERLLRRIVRYGHGWNPLGVPSDEDVDRLRGALADAGRDPTDFELVGGTRGRFPEDDSLADLDEALATIGAGRAGLRPSASSRRGFLDDRSRRGVVPGRRRRGGLLSDSDATTFQPQHERTRRRPEQDVALHAARREWPRSRREGFPSSVPSGRNGGCRPPPRPGATSSRQTRRRRIAGVREHLPPVRSPRADRRTAGCGGPACRRRKARLVGQNASPFGAEVVGDDLDGAVGSIRKT
jgi:probable F420-dependent oxidoreductase